MLILEGNPVCANNSKDTTKKNVQNKTSACVFPGISDKMNSVNVNEKKKSLSSNKTELHQQVVTTCHVIKKETRCSHVQPTFLNIAQSVTQMLK